MIDLAAIASLEQAALSKIHKSFSKTKENTTEASNTGINVAPNHAMIDKVDLLENSHVTEVINIYDDTDDDIVVLKSSSNTNKASSAILIVDDAMDEAMDDKLKISLQPTIISVHNTPASLSATATSSKEPHHSKSLPTAEFIAGPKETRYRFSKYFCYFNFLNS